MYYWRVKIVSFKTFLTWSWFYQDLLFSIRRKNLFQTWNFQIINENRFWMSKYLLLEYLICVIDFKRNFTTDSVDLMFPVRTIFYFQDWELLVGLLAQSSWKHLFFHTLPTIEEQYYIQLNSTSTMHRLFLSQYSVSRFDFFISFRWFWWLALIDILPPQASVP